MLACLRFYNYMNSFQPHLDYNRMTVLLVLSRERQATRSVMSKLQEQLHSSVVPPATWRNHTRYHDTALIFLRIPISSFFSFHLSFSLSLSLCLCLSPSLSFSLFLPFSSFTTKINVCLMTKSSQTQSICLVLSVLFAWTLSLFCSSLRSRNLSFEPRRGPAPGSKTHLEHVQSLTEMFPSASPLPTANRHDDRTDSCRYDRRSDDSNCTEHPDKDGKTVFRREMFRPLWGFISLSKVSEPDESPRQGGQIVSRQNTVFPSLSGCSQLHIHSYYYA